MKDKRGGGTREKKMEGKRRRKEVKPKRVCLVTDYLLEEARVQEPALSAHPSPQGRAQQPGTYMYGTVCATRVGGS